jgi:DNA-binding MarR family transcriptional regulator
VKELREGGFLMAKVHQIAGRIFARKLKEQGIEEINPAQGRILFVLWKEDDIPISELARRTALEKSTLTSMLDRLEESGFVERVRSTEDRRTILLRRTEKDKACQKAYVELSNEMNELFYAGLSEEEVDQFEGVLRHILETLTAFEAENR